jgi:hypothetical protein
MALNLSRVFYRMPETIVTNPLYYKTQQEGVEGDQDGAFCCFMYFCCFFPLMFGSLR